MEAEHRIMYLTLQSKTDRDLRSQSALTHRQRLTHSPTPGQERTGDSEQRDVAVSLKMDIGHEDICVPYKCVPRGVRMGGVPTDNTTSSQETYSLIQPLSPISLELIVLEKSWNGGYVQVQQHSFICFFFIQSAWVFGGMIHTLCMP